MNKLNESYVGFQNEIKKNPDDMSYPIYWHTAKAWTEYRL